MKRAWIFLGILALLTLTLVAPAAAQEKSELCTDPATNSTVEELCNRIDRLNDRNNKLKANVTALRGQVEKLEYDLNHSQDMQSLVEGMGFLYEGGNPQVLLLRLQKENAQEASKKFGLFQKCQPQAMNRGGFDFDNDGVKEYCEVPISQVGDSPLAPIKIELYYAEPGMNKTFVLDQSNAKGRLEQIQEKLNDRGGVAAYDGWTDYKLWSATESSFKSSIGIGIGGLVVGIILTLIFAPVIRKVRERRRVSKSQRTGFQSPDQGLLNKLKRLFNR